MLPLVILWAGGVDRTLFYKWEREARGLSVGHLVEYIDPLQPLVPRVLDLSSSTRFMNAELEDERNPPWGVGDRLIFVQRGANDVSSSHKAFFTLGFARLPPGAYWGCTSRIIILIRRDLQLVKDRARITIPWTAFLKLLAYYCSINASMVAIKKYMRHTQKQLETTTGGKLCLQRRYLRCVTLFC